MDGIISIYLEIMAKYLTNFGVDHQLLKQDRQNEHEFRLMQWVIQGVPYNVDLPRALRHCIYPASG